MVDIEQPDRVVIQANIVISVSTPDMEAEDAIIFAKKNFFEIISADSAEIVDIDLQK